MVEFWRGGGSESTTSVAVAQRVEAEGWDGQMFMDSQSLCADPFVRMGAWAAGTQRLKLSPGVTNPLTRHLAVTAAAAATVQSISGGRAVLGIGRGDSALAFLGHAPTTLSAFRRALTNLQTLLSGGEVPFVADTLLTDAPKIETISLGDRPHMTRLQWLPPGMAKVPLDVAATGPKVIEMAAQIAEQVTFSVGAIPERIAWAIGLARAARQKLGLTDAGVSYGAQIIVVCHPDLEAMRPIATAMVTPLARFQVMLNDAVGPQNDDDTENFTAIRKGYDMTKHSVSLADKIKGGTLSWDFVRRFAIVGPPDHCVARLRELIALGLDRIVVVGPGFHTEVNKDGPSLFARDVIPAIKR